MKKASKIQLGWTSNNAIQNKSPFNPERMRIGFYNKKEGKGRKKPFFFTGDEGHLMTIAPTGSGKGRNAIIPTLLSYDGPVMVIDPKGEAYNVTARKRKEFGEVIVIDPFHLVSDKPDKLNPLDIHQLSSDSVCTQAMKITELLTEKSSLKDPFWDNKANAVISGIIAYIMTEKEGADRNLSVLRDLLGNEDVTYNLAVILDNHKELIQFAKSEIAQFIQTTDVTRSGILATAQQHIHILGDPKVTDSLSETTFDLEAYKNGANMSIYLVIPPDKLNSHAALLRLWVATLLDVLIERKKRPEKANLFIIDEAAQLGEMESLRTAVTLLRGYGCRIWTAWQCVSQLKRHYKDDWQSIINNTAVMQTFGVNNYLMAKELSSILGDIKPSKLLQMKPEEQLVVTPGAKLNFCERMDYLTDAKFKKQFDHNRFYR